MKPERLKRLQAATEVGFLKARQKVQPILDEEASARHNLARLAQQENDNRAATGSDQAMQSLGADMLWRSWVAKTRRQLNFELARVMVRKEPAMEDVRRAFGRKEAMRLLLEAERRKGGPGKG